MSAPKVDVLKLRSDVLATLADELLPAAQKAIAEMDRPGITGLQRRLKIGYNRAARFMEAFEAIGWLRYDSTYGRYSHVDRAALAALKVQP